MRTGLQFRAKRFDLKNECMSSMSISTRVQDAVGVRRCAAGGTIDRKEARLFALAPVHANTRHAIDDAVNPALAGRGL